MHSKLAASMMWFVKEHSKDGNLRHPTNGQAWKDFDSLYPNFTRKPHNIRLDLTSNIFKPL